MGCTLAGEMEPYCQYSGKYPWGLSWSSWLWSPLTLRTVIDRYIHLSHQITNDYRPSTLVQRLLPGPLSNTHGLRLACRYIPRCTSTLTVIRALSTEALSQGLNKNSSHHHNYASGKIARKKTANNMSTPHMPLRALFKHSNSSPKARCSRVRPSPRHP
jgi:hypothetical protein